ncbi:hypothetical protein [Frigoribacterium sp. CG_9.8]|uniref:hypothetical protein n=1 Tax=Frigoribacterium sp. CG_9.8 TaxID=2787733 RepID=UPI0018CADF01|nr:hypothetical protein [Frigoribacterium sp. CG_9.8]MBG6108585.1 hypothetical protein [Frigoribacterium sp. CG_9.8]
MAAGNDTGPHPLTSPFDWGLGSADMPDAAPLVPAIPTTTPAVYRPEPYFTSDSDGHSDDDPDADSDADPAASTDSFAASSTALPIDSHTASPIDSLFGETQFKDYEGEPLVGPPPPGLNPFAGIFAGAPDGAALSASTDSPVIDERTTSTALPRRRRRAAFSKNEGLLFWLAGGAIALLVLVVLFVIGTKIAEVPTTVGASTSATPNLSPSVSPSAASTSGTTGPVAVGIHLWSDLRGGECVDPYSSAFDLRFTVVACGAPHPAQMVFRGTFPGEQNATYPGLESLQSQINLLCSAPGVIDLQTAGAYSDIQFQASYAATSDEWTAGQHDYFCFVKRAGGEAITGSVAGTPVK